MHNKSQKLYRPTWAEVDLTALEHNYRKVRACAPRIKILAALKADAYGHGAWQVACRLLRCGIDYCGVATLREAISLRAHSMRIPILLLTSIGCSEYEVLLRYAITPTIADYQSAQRLNDLCKRRKRRTPIHIKIDTGMGRIGIWHAQALDAIERMQGFEYLKLEGIYTHLPSADEDRRFTQKQLGIFYDLIHALEKKGIHIALKHAANSAALMRYKHSLCTMVRPGIMLYGLYPDMKSKRLLDLKPVLSFKTRVTYLKDVAAGRSISYGRTYTAKKKLRIVTIPVGYADGYNRLLSNRASVLVDGTRCPVVGRICMDHTMIDVSNANARIGSDVVLIGKQKQQEIKAEEIATLCSTISYEVVCWISKRVPRLYRG